MTMTLNLTPELERQLRAEAARIGVPADALVLRAVEDRLGAVAGATTTSLPGLGQRESELLGAINAGFPSEFWERYHLLRSKLDAGLSPAERAELLGLSDRIEAAQVERLKLAMELAKLRGVPVDELLRQLGISSEADTTDDEGNE
jgi:hypothetical protein